MGVVYEALDRERGARVALKTLRPNLDGGDTLQRFKNEFRWLQDLHHPNVVSFGELFGEDGRWFFTMELVEGDDFLAWVRPTHETRERPELDVTRLRAALPQLARGLHALHRAGKVHRDVKLHLRAKFPERVQLPAPRAYEYYRPERSAVGAPLTVTVRG